VLPFLLTMGSDPTRLNTPDSFGYMELARSLQTELRFAGSAGPETFHPPGYPVFLALTARPAGVEWTAALLWQMSLTAMTIPLVWSAARRIWDAGAPTWIAVALCALDPMAWVYSQKLLSESLFSAVFLLHLWLAMPLVDSVSDRGRTRELRPRALLAGIVGAAATFLRPVTYYWVVILGLLIVVRGLRGTPRRSRALGIVGMVFVGWFSLVLPWQFRNFEVSGSPEFASVQSHNLLMYRAAGVVSATEHIPLETARELLIDRRSTADQRDGRNTDFGLASAILVAHPWATVRTMAAGAGRLLTGPGRTVFRLYLGDGAPWGVGASILHRILLFVCVFAAVVRSRRILPGASGQAGLLTGAAIYLLLFSSGPESYSRFVVPILPILSILAGGIAGSRRSRGPSSLPRADRSTDSDSATLDPLPSL
ncbi:MAG: hypothetical protein KC729_09205, partial [Candidatus Eisenbacteria bacterium]|nr:hypothetical protein [Candidatus Eisenbacteria bacterium]